MLRTACAIRGPEGFAANISVHCKGDTYSPSIMLLQHKPGNIPIRFHSFMHLQIELDRAAPLGSPRPPCTAMWPPHLASHSCTHSLGCAHGSLTPGCLYQLHQPHAYNSRQNSHITVSNCCVSQHNWEKGRRISQVSTAQRWKNQVTRAPTAKQHSFAELDTKIEAKASKLLFNPLVAPDSFTSCCFLLPAAGSWTTIRDQTQAKDTPLNHS